MAEGLASILRPQSRNRRLIEREQRFSVSSSRAPLPKYDSLYDTHLRNMWLTPRIRNHLKATGFVDEEGNSVDVDNYRRKMHVIEQELVHADRFERDRVQDKERRAIERQIRAKRQEAEDRRRRMVSLVREERALQLSKRTPRFQGLRRDSEDSDEGEVTELKLPPAIDIPPDA